MTIRNLEEQYSCLNASDGASFIKNIHAAKNDAGISTLSLIGFLDRTSPDSFRKAGAYARRPLTCHPRKRRYLRFTER